MKVLEVSGLALSVLDLLLFNKVLSQDLRVRPMLSGTWRSSAYRNL